MMDSYSETILNHYKTVADESGLSPLSTMADPVTRSLETDVIMAFAAKVLTQNANLHVFDVGCGNGFTLSELKTRFPKATFTGFEYTPALAEIAQSRFGKDSDVKIVQADIRADDWHAGKTADLIIVQRVLINLLDEQHQIDATRNILARLNPGGAALFIEAFESGQNQLNDVRAEFDLSPIPPAHHNLLLKESFFEQFAKIAKIANGDFHIDQNFCSTHYFVARVIHPILLGNKAFKRNSLFVRFMSEALKANIGNFSPLQAIVLQKSR